MGGKGYGSNANAPGDNQISVATTSLTFAPANLNNNTVTSNVTTITGTPRLSVNCDNSTSGIGVTVVVQILRSTTWVSLPPVAVGAGATVFQAFDPVVGSRARIQATAAGVATPRIDFSAAA